jgi:hypothetical protein
MLATVKALSSRAYQELHLSKFTNLRIAICLSLLTLVLLWMVYRLFSLHLQLLAFEAALLARQEQLRAQQAPPHPPTLPPTQPPANSPRPSPK